MKWIRASERLPKHNNIVSAKIYLNDPDAGSFFENRTDSGCYFKALSGLKYKLEDVEWLDETLESTPTRTEQDLTQPVADYREALGGYENLRVAYETFMENMGTQCDQAMQGVISPDIVIKRFFNQHFYVIAQELRKLEPARAVLDKYASK
jgi:hypothetical protein